MNLASEMSEVELNNGLRQLPSLQNLSEAARVELRA